MITNEAGPYIRVLLRLFFLCITALRFSFVDSVIFSQPKRYDLWPYNV